MEWESEFQTLLDKAINPKGSSINAAPLHNLLSQMIEKLASAQAGQKLAAKVPVSVMDWLSKDRKKAPEEGAANKKPAWMMLVKAANQQPPTNAVDKSGEDQSPIGNSQQANVSVSSAPSIDHSAADQHENGKENVAGKESASPSPLFKEISDRLEKVESLLWRYEGRSEMGLPANDVLVKGGETCEGGEKPLTEMWQAIRLRNKVEANESGINKLISIYEELNLNIRELKIEIMEKNEYYAQKLEDMKSQIGECQDMSSSLKEKMTDLDSSVSDFCSVAEKGIVTWDNLEKALHQQNNAYDPMAKGKNKQSKENINAANESYEHDGNEEEKALADVSPKLKNSLKELGLVAEGYKDLIQQNESVKAALQEKDGKMSELEDLKRIISQLNVDMDTLARNYDKNSEAMKQLKKNAKKKKVPTATLR